MKNYASLMCVFDGVHIKSVKAWVNEPICNIVVKLRLDLAQSKI